MAICAYCNQEMMTAEDCTVNRVIKYEDGSRFAIPYDLEDPDRVCNDCNVKSGNYHHPGCDMEICPKCRGQLISCDCNPLE